MPLFTTDSQASSYFSLDNHLASQPTDHSRAVNLVLAYNSTMVSNQIEVMIRDQNDTSFKKMPLALVAAILNRGSSIPASFKKFTDRFEKSNQNTEERLTVDY